MICKLHPAAQHGFSQAAKLYQHARPHYPHQIVSWLQQDLKLNQHSALLDLGSGTGKFIPYLQQISRDIIAIEPIHEMLEQLQLQYPEIHCIQTDSKQLGLAAESLDAVICAQSFHWFANTASLDEIYRVLKPQAALGLIWNQRDISVEWVKAIAELIAPLEADTPRFHNGAWQQAFAHNRQFQLQSTKSFRLCHSGTVEQVAIKRILSTSFIAAAAPQVQERIRQQLLDIFQEYLALTPTDHIDFPYITYAYYYQKC